MKEIKIGLVGCGAVAPTHINSYKQIPGATVKTICDLKRDKAAAMAAKLGVPNFTENFTDMLNDPEIDLIDICTDHASHSPLAVAAMAKILPDMTPLAFRSSSIAVLRRSLPNTA